MSKNTQISELINYLSVDGSGNIVITGSLIGPAGATYATQSYVTTAISNLVNAAPTALDTLAELSAALNNDASFATTVTNSLAGKQAQLNGTGFVKISGSSISYDNSTYLTTSSASSTYLPLVGGALTGGLTGTTASFSSFITAQSTGGSGLRIYGSSGTNQWDIYLNSTNLRFSDNTGTGSVVFDRPISGTSATLSSSISIGGSFGFPNGSISATGELSFNSSSPNIYTYGRIGLVNAGRIIFNNGTGANLFFGEIAGNIYGFTANAYNSTPVLTMDMGANRVGIGVTPSYPLDMITSSSGTFNTIAQFQNTDYTSGNRSFIRVRQWVNAGGSSSSYFGTGQDSNLYIIANNSARGGDLIINAGTGDATFNSAITSKGNITIDKGSPTLRLAGSAYGNSGARIQFEGWAPASGYSNWQIDTAFTGANELCFVPSTTAGGSTFTTPVFRLSSTGAGTFSSIIDGTIIRLSNTQPLSFTGGGNTGTYTQSAIYSSQNNTSGDTGNGIFIERGRITDSGSGEIRHFVIGARGGSIQWKINADGYTTQYDTAEVKARADGLDLFVGRYSAGSAKLFRVYQSSADGYLELRTGADTVVTKLSGYSGTQAYMNTKLTVGGTGSYSAATLNVEGSGRFNRSTYAWYQGGTNSWDGYAYLHLKTNMWAGGSPSGNIHYTMSLFYCRLYSYSSNYIREGHIAFHNWSGSIYSLTTTGTAWSNAYVSSDGYVVLVVALGSGTYFGVTVDWHQAFGYPFQDKYVTATSPSNSTSGAY